jgi:hypothetical protein
LFDRMSVHLHATGTIVEKFLWLQAFTQPNIQSGGAHSVMTKCMSACMTQAYEKRQEWSRCLGVREASCTEFLIHRLKSASHPPSSSPNSTAGALALCTHIEGNGKIFQELVRQHVSLGGHTSAGRSWQHRRQREEAAG